MHTSLSVATVSMKTLESFADHGQVPPTRHSPFGNHTQAFAEPSWYTGSPSVYYGPSHVTFRKRVRDFVENHLKDKASEWEEEANAGKELDLDVFKQVTFFLVEKTSVICDV